jgi:hypothetical protein
MDYIKETLLEDFLQTIETGFEADRVLKSQREVFDNQYYPVFDAVPQKKTGLRRINISSEAATTEIAAADNLWVPLKPSPAAMATRSIFSALSLRE